MNTFDSSIKAAIDEFIDSQRVDRGSSRRTIEAYRHDLSEFASWLKPGTPLSKIESRLVEGFLGQLARSGKQPSSIARKTSALRQFFRFCVLEKKLERNPAENLETPSLPKKLPKHLGPERVQALLDAADVGLEYKIKDADRLAALRARDAAMVYLLYATGLRVSELVGLRVSNIDLEQGYVRVRGKGDKERIAPFAPVAGERLYRYLREYRSLLTPKESEFLFANRKGKPLTRQSFWKNLGDLARQCGVASALSPHMLRHSFAVHLLQSGMNLRSLQTVLGHADLSTTQIYTHVTPGHLKAAHRKYHPRGGG